ncbi:Tex family protein [Acetohalobium arabaticum]|uniref:Tex-like protein n=1 Tax=Acetohalobium arabaticum (strain ATCC 49924 / DSM 5501 / Z-7288) TaxID=574087 RepID=D9QSW4_ACEAZ|nr:Tex family protein [Acetohalobium arabaticum]ADL11652.1 Tex-like protein [Acetohalobium arabaticum DSM 5501]
MNQARINEKLAAELNLAVKQVRNTVELLDEGNTIPFIARYRKEATGSLDETELRELDEKLEYLRNLAERKEKVIELIDDQDKLTAELEEKISQASKLQTVEDLYRPYRQKRKTRAAKAKDKGLEPLAELFLAQKLESGSIKELAEDYLNPEEELTEIEDVLQGTRDIIAEYVADKPEVRQVARRMTFDKGSITSEVKEDEDDNYRDYHEYQEEVEEVDPYQTLALNRGEDEEALQVKVEAPDEDIIRKIKEMIIENQATIFLEEIEEAIEDGYQRLVAPAIGREVRNKLTDEAEEHAINIFADNLKTLLLQPPVRDKRVLGIDPGFRTGSKVAVVDEIGNLLATAAIYPHPPQKKVSEAKEQLEELITEYNVDLIAIGNGTACRETEELAAEIIKESELDLHYVIVNEAGASVYSASEVAQDEFPKLDVSLRGTVSIARRLQDPLAELVKIDSKHLGVGMYQHDLNQGELDEALETVVESVVNYVGVDLNTASTSLLGYVAGVNKTVANNIVQWREENGKFSSRDQLKDVYGIGPKTFTQAAGFLRIFDGEDKLAATAIHPESYSAARKLLKETGFKLKDLDFKENQDLKERLNNLNLKELTDKIGVGFPTLLDIKKNLVKPGRDPREEMSKPVFKQEVMSWDDLKSGMILQGEIRNVVDFGAFVDIGVKEDGLVHISEMSSEYVEDPFEVVKVGDVVKIKILEIDSARKRIALTMNF